MVSKEKDQRDAIRLVFIDGKGQQLNPEITRTVATADLSRLKKEESFKELKTTWIQQQRIWKEDAYNKSFMEDGDVSKAFEKATTLAVGDTVFVPFNGKDKTLDKIQEYVKAKITGIHGDILTVQPDDKSAGKLQGSLAAVKTEGEWRDAVEAHQKNPFFASHFGTYHNPWEAKKYMNEVLKLNSFGGGRDEYIEKHQTNGQLTHAQILGRFLNIQKMVPKSIRSKEWIAEYERLVHSGKTHDEAIALLTNYFETKKKAQAEFGSPGFDFVGTKYEAAPQKLRDLRDLRASKIVSEIVGNNSELRAYVQMRERMNHAPAMEALRAFSAGIGTNAAAADERIKKLVNTTLKEFAKSQNGSDQPAILEKFRRDVATAQAEKERRAQEERRAREAAVQAEKAELDASQARVAAAAAARPAGAAGSGVPETVHASRASAPPLVEAEMTAAGAGAGAGAGGPIVPREFPVPGVAGGGAIDSEDRTENFFMVGGAVLGVGSFIMAAVSVLR